MTPVGSNDASFNTGNGFNDGILVTRHFANTQIPPSALNLGPQTAFVNTNETTSSTSYADLTTTTDSVTVNIGSNGLALVSIFSFMLNNTATDSSYVGFAVSGANTISANDNEAIQFQAFANNGLGQYGATFLLTGLTSGATTFKMKYRVQAGTGTWGNRRIAVIPL